MTTVETNDGLELEGSRIVTEGVAHLCDDSGYDEVVLLGGHVELYDSVYLLEQIVNNKH